MTDSCQDEDDFWLMVKMGMTHGCIAVYLCPPRNLEGEIAPDDWQGQLGFVYRVGANTPGAL